MSKQLWFLLVLLSLIVKAKSQDGIPGQVTASFVQVRDVNSRNKKPVKRPCLLWLPSSYSDNSNLPFYPLLVFLHRSKYSEQANRTVINELGRNGPFYFLQNKKWTGTAGYGGNCGQTGFIVFAMQVNGAADIDAGELDYAIAQLLLRYRIDERRIIFTGINDGAESILRYTFDSTRTNQPRLVVPMSIPFSSGSSGVIIAAKKGVKIWAFTFDKDFKAGINFRTNTVRLVNDFNNAVSGSAKLTITSGTNCCWNKYYDPAFREADTDSTKQVLNIYEWVMKNISWGDASPPIYACNEYVNTPNNFAGYITTSGQRKKDIANKSCTIPVYTIDGKINNGSIIYGQKYGENIAGNNLHYGYSTSKLKAAAANKHLVINLDGKVIIFE